MGIRTAEGVGIAFDFVLGTDARTAKTRPEAHQKQKPDKQTRKKRCEVYFFFYPCWPAGSCLLRVFFFYIPKL